MAAAKKLKTRLNYNPQKLMEMAVEVMRASVPEPRDDGKVNPKVGAVLWKPDGVLESACRGELRMGDHAEYTLLERKSRSVDLSDCILFATLEPCAPKSRNHPKLGCAERIVNARIRTVWVGVEDPDPTVDRKGIKYLQDHGVTVHMFERSLQAIILTENAAFIKQALQRAASAQEKPVKRVSLSSLEGVVDSSDFSDLSPEALEGYRRAVGIPGHLDGPEFSHFLIKQGLLDKTGVILRPTGFGLLLFGRSPRLALPQSGLLATIQYPDGQQEVRDFDGPLVLIPEQLEKWLRDKLPNVVERSSMRRQTLPALPFEVVREAVVNALIHRDYDIHQAKCQLIVTAETLILKSPGGPVPSITLPQLQSFSASTLSRNPKLHYVFARMDLAEERGLGLRSLKERPKALGLPLPRFTWEDPYLVLTLFRNPESSVRTLPENLVEELTESELKGLVWLTNQGRSTSSKYARALRVDERTARRHLNRFLKSGLVKKSGSGPSIRYEVSE